MRPEATDEVAGPTGGDAVRLEGVGRRYGSGHRAVTALADVDLVVARGEYLALQGRSGSGKTTLLNIIGGLDRADAGRVEVVGRDITRASTDELVRLRRDRLAFVFQAFGLLPILSASENVEVPLRLRRVPVAERRDRVAELLAQVGLEGRAGHRPHEMSGGEQQRVAIARALANDPELLIADEPTGQLDSTTGRRIMELLRTVVAQRGLSLLVATHDPTMIADADRTVGLRDGHLVDDPELLEHAVQAPAPVDEEDPVVAQDEPEERSSDADDPSMSAGAAQVQPAPGGRSPFAPPPGRGGVSGEGP